MPVLPELGPQDALIIVDVQPDFCPGGALPILGGDDVVPVLNKWIDRAVDGGALIIASRDWHPATHMSFRDEGGPWPPHCLQDTPGAAFHPDLRLPSSVWKVTKGTRFDRDQYSAFDETGLAEALRARGIRRLWIGGLALDVCVKATALDALGAGFETHLIRSATRPVTPEGGVQALEALRAAGVQLEP
jgi:nicotinamidase/pyrazinamidase